MIKEYRDNFNAGFTEEKYKDFLLELENGYPPIDFRVAETPVFIPGELRHMLINAGQEIIDFIKRPDFKSLTDEAIPFRWEVPFENNHPHFIALDFGICKDEKGVLTPKLIEMQGFPSLYFFQMHLANCYKSVYNLPEGLSPFFPGMDQGSYIELLRKVIVGDHEPKHVALMDIDAPDQKTAIDFYITAKHLGIKIVNLKDIFKDGNKIYYKENGVHVQIKRIYNRLIFDEVADDTDLFKEFFDPRDPSLELEWVTHPNWFYRISKYTMPLLNSAYIPETFFLNQMETLPENLEDYVLKPLFSFAGIGVKIDVTAEDIENVVDPQNWILQRKVKYEPVVMSPSGGVKAEIRLLYVWADDEEPKLCINLARLSRGKMIGVRYNKDFDWVGGTVGLMES
jgi:glutathionylspermidine synthase